MKSLERANKANNAVKKKTLNEEKDSNILSNINYGIKEVVNINKKKRNNNEGQETIIIRKVKKKLDLNETPTFEDKRSFSFRNNKKVEDIDNNIIRIDNHGSLECSFGLQKQEYDKHTNDTNRRIYNSAEHNNNRVRRRANNKGCCDKICNMCKNKQCQII